MIDKDILSDDAIFKKYPILIVAVILLILTLSLSLMLINMDKPFIRRNEDDNALYGLAAQNMAKFGIWKMKAGLATVYYDDFKDIGSGYYTHHPQIFVLPTVLSYKLFGVSEASTRLPSILFSWLALAAFCLTIYLYYDDYWIAALSGFVYALLPGLIFYSSSFSEKVFVIVFSNFVILAFFLLQKYQRYFYKFVLIFFIFYGGLQGWHFFFVPFALWLYTILSKKIFARKFLLISLPITAVASFVTTIIHFYILKGWSFIPDLLSIFELRTSGITLKFFFHRIFFFAKFNFTWEVALIAVVYVIYTLYNTYLKKIDLLFIFLIQPLLVTLVFNQWTASHGFGTIYWSQFAALATGLALTQLMRRRSLGFYRYIASGFIILLFTASAISNTLLFQKTRILGARDAKLLKVTASTLPPNATIAIGRNSIGYAYGAIAQWYMQRKLYPKNSANGVKADYIIAFHPALGTIEKIEMKNFTEAGYSLYATGDHLAFLKYH